MNKHEGKKTKHILIVGGMGPQASVYAHSLLIKTATSSGAVNNEDYPRVTHLSVNVKDFISDPKHREDACRYLLRCLNDINVNDVDEAFIACNTAHILQGELEAATGLRFTSLIETAVDEIITDKEITKVGLVSTPSTLRTGLYHDRLSKFVEVIHPSEEAMTRVEDIIRSVIEGNEMDVAKDRLREEIGILLANGAQRVILGCTELSLLGSQLNWDVVVDPLALTVDKVLS